LFVGIQDEPAEVIARIRAAAAPLRAVGVTMTDDQENEFDRALGQFRELQESDEFDDDDDAEEEVEQGEQAEREIFLVLDRCCRCGERLSEDAYYNNESECTICVNRPPQGGHIEPELGFCRHCGRPLVREDYDNEEFINHPVVCTQCSNMLVEINDYYR